LRPESDEIKIPLVEAYFVGSGIQVRRSGGHEATEFLDSERALMRAHGFRGAVACRNDRVSATTVRCQHALR
jgi:hypothetical protein